MGQTADESKDESQDDQRRDDAREGQGPGRDGDARRRRHSDQASKQEASKQEADTAQGPTFAAPETQRVTDLSNELMKVLPRATGQMVRCRRIVGDQYRCNWWGSLGASTHDNAGGGLMITRYRVVKSRMLRATLTREGVAIDADGVQ
jgi:hypothetical protein